MKVNISIVVMMAVMVVQAQQRPSIQINNPAVLSEQNPSPFAFNPSPAEQEEENFEVPAVEAQEFNDDSFLTRAKRHHKGGYYGGYNRGYYGYGYPYYSYNNG